MMDRLIMDRISIFEMFLVILIDRISYKYWRVCQPRCITSWVTSFFEYRYKIGLK